MIEIERDLTKREQFPGIWGELEQFFMVYLFPIAPVKVTTKMIDKRNTNLLSYSCGSQKSEVFYWVKINVSAELPSFLEEGEFVLLPLPASRVFLDSLAHGPFNLQSQQGPSPFAISHVLMVLLPFSTFKGP